MKRNIVFFVFVMILSEYSCSKKVDKEIHEPTEILVSPELIVGDINDPWGMAFLPNGSMLITQKSGEIIHFEDGQKTKVSNVPEIKNWGQGGLMDIVLGPNYAESGWIYISYVSPGGDNQKGSTAIMRGNLKNNSLVNNELLYKVASNSTNDYHFGSRIAFDNAGYLYFSVGERGERDKNPQDITRDNGKIYRLNPDGSIPADNPFVNEPGAKVAIYSHGHRNPQGLIKNPRTGEIWEHEHGPQGGDEINIIQKGKNYGWPVITYGIDYDDTFITDKTEMPDMEQPLYYWVPSIAPSGMVYVTSDKYPQWKDNLLVGSLKFQYLERLELKDNKVVYREKLLKDIGRVRDVRQAPDGYIYVAVEGKGIYKLVPKAEIP